MIILIYQMRRKPVLDSIFAASREPGEKRHTDELVKGGLLLLADPAPGATCPARPVPIRQSRKFVRGGGAVRHARMATPRRSRWVIGMMSSPQLVRRQTFLARSRGSPAVETCKRVGAAPSRRMPKPRGRPTTSSGH